MFRIICDPSLGSKELYLTEIHGGSVNHYKFQSSTALYPLMMDRIRSETCRSDVF